MVYASKLSAGCQNWRIPGSHCPASLLEAAISRLNKRALEENEIENNEETYLKLASGIERKGGGGKCTHPLTHKSTYT